METTTGSITVENHKGVTTIEFFHPQSNSLPGALLRELAKTINRTAHEDDVRVIVLRSKGKTFCAGASFDELASIQTEAEGLHFFSGFAEVINAIRKSPYLVIAMVQGKCVGGGVGLAAAADYAIAHESADIKLSELAVGIGPFVVGPAVERKIGLSAFSSLAIDATMWRNSDWAKRKGLFCEVHPTQDGMDESITRLADTLSHSSKDALLQIKKMLWAGTDHWDHLLTERAAVSGTLVLSEHSKNAIEKFKSK